MSMINAAFALRKDITDTEMPDAIAKRETYIFR